MRRFFKATCPDGCSFHASPNGERPRYLPGDVVRVPHDRRSPKLCTPGVIHASNAEGETLIGGSWPCRLFEVEGEPVVGPEQDPSPQYNLSLSYGLLSIVLAALAALLIAHWLMPAVKS